jgi:hypothetical protein
MRGPYTFDPGLVSRLGPLLLIRPNIWISGSFATQGICRNPIWLPRKRLNENSDVKLPTKSPEVNRSGEYRPGENVFPRIHPGCSG